MTHYALALLGFGSVGQAFAKLLLRKQQTLLDRYDITFSVTGIATKTRGTAIDHDGIDLDTALRYVSEGVSLSALSKAAVTDTVDFIRSSGANVLFENSPVSYHDGQPAIDYIRTALEAGMHAITANKGPVVHGYHALTKLAHDNGVKFLFESTVMDGAPVFALHRSAIPAAEVKAVYGVLNSTTNLLLGRMEAGETFDEAVAYAQSIGIAETDPSGDIDGWDAAVKVSALVTVYMGIPTTPDTVDRTGIRGITREDVQQAAEAGKRYKLVCSAVREGEQVITKVAPQLVDSGSPLYGVTGTSSIVQIETDVLGKLSIIEEDPGPHTTAYGLLADFINAVC